MTTMITNLPRDLMEDIVSRVPLKSMRAVRLTCREWNTLSKSRSFTKLHFAKTSAATKEEDSRMIVIIRDNHNLYLMSVFVNDTDPSTEHKGKLTCLNEQVKISHVFHCDGLLLCILKEDDTKVVVWNPYSVTVKGNTYWWATEQNSHGENNGWNDHIICFDFTTERFEPLLPLPCPCNDLVTVSCVREEKLAAVCQNRGNPHSFEIWITTMIEAEKVSWSNFLIISRSYPSSTLSHGNFSIDEVKKVAMIFEIKWNRYIVKIIGESGYVRQVDLEEAIEESRWPRGCSYVPSLVEIKQPKGGQRKEQSILEKRIYDQHMLRLSVFKWRCIRLAAAKRMGNKFQFG